jgi:hypothetical protein
MAIHDSDVSLPSPGSAQDVRSPDSPVLSRRCDSPMSVSRRFVAFANAIPRLPTALISFPTPPRAFVASSLELVDPATPPRDNARGDIGVSQVPVKPRLLVCHVRATPAGRSSQDHSVGRPCCPRSFNDEGSDNSTFEALWHGFRTRCLRLAVLVTQPHARLASGCWSGFAGRDFHPKRLR